MPSEVTPKPLNSVHISTGEKPNTEPTDRSNSPEVISSVIASAISPSSTVKASMLLMFSGDRKSWLIDQNDEQFDHQQHERPELGPGDQPLSRALSPPACSGAGMCGASSGSPARSASARRAEIDRSEKDWSDDILVWPSWAE